MKIGNLDISSFKVGGADCSIYLGDTKLYPEEEPTLMNIITYNASAKLSETTDLPSSGLHTNAFSGTSSQQLTMTSHTFENGVGTIEFDGDIARIGTWAFFNCSSLTSVNIPNSVTSIGSYVFYTCGGLRNIDIPSGVTNIGNRAFAQCGGLTSVTVNASTPPILGSDVFSSTHNCPIYVPAASVDTYKAATNWSTYASRIQAIPT